MARRRRERMSEGKKNIIAGLIQEYDRYSGSAERFAWWNDSGERPVSHVFIGGKAIR